MNLGRIWQAENERFGKIKKKKKILDISNMIHSVLYLSAALFGSPRPRARAAFQRYQMTKRLQVKGLRLQQRYLLN